MDAIESSPNATTEIAASSSAWAAFLNGLAPPQVPAAGADIHERTRATYQMVSATVAAAWGRLAFKHPHLLAFFFLRVQEANPALTPAQQAAFHENFTKSYAVMTLILWILGMGDRHLGNFLITPTGFLIPIDYDLVMGRGQMTPVPDVVPVRCTDQIERAIHLPYVKGIMADVMRAFQSYRNTIMRSLELLKVVPPRNTLALVWDGRRGFVPNGERLAQIKRILDGAMPHVVLRDSLSQHHPNKPWLARLQAVVTSSLPIVRQPVLTMPAPVYQIDTLFLLARSGRLLSRMHIGWASWI
ncbi:kinase-like domain-containing protein [Geranomyces variabilis]|nr:kinase-like domain-containing protein [Geranomyces variabilis]